MTGPVSWERVRYLLSIASDLDELGAQEMAFSKRQEAARIRRLLLQRQKPQATAKSEAR